MRSPTYTHARAGSAALVPGITLWRETGADGYPRWRVRASAQVEGVQRTRSWGLAQRHTLGEALQEAAAFRAAHQEGASTTELLDACWAAIPPEQIAEMRADGADVSRPHGP